MLWLIAESCNKCEYDSNQKIVEKKYDGVLCEGYSNEEITTFVEKLRIAVGVNDFNTVSNLMSYPYCRWYPRSKKKKQKPIIFKNRKHFLKHYDQVISEHKNVIFNVKYTQEYFISKSDACGTDYGELWVDFGDGIITFNRSLKDNQN